MFFRKAKKINELKRTIGCLKEVINSLKEENEDYKKRLFDIEIKAATKTTRKTTKRKTEKK